MQNHTVAAVTSSPLALHTSPGSDTSSDSSSKKSFDSQRKLVRFDEDAASASSVSHEASAPESIPEPAVVVESMPESQESAPTSPVTSVPTGRESLTVTIDDGKITRSSSYYASADESMVSSGPPTSYATASSAGTEESDGEHAVAQPEQPAEPESTQIGEIEDEEEMAVQASPPPVLVEPEVPDPFLVDSEESSAEEGEAPGAASELASHEISLAQSQFIVPPAADAAPAPDVNKEVPPAPQPQSDSEDEDQEMPEFHLSALVSPTMFLPIPNVRFAPPKPFAMLIWWLAVRA